MEIGTISEDDSLCIISSLIKLAANDAIKNSGREKRVAGREIILRLVAIR